MPDSLNPADLAQRINQMPPDEQAIVQTLVDRLDTGRQSYGPWRLGDGRQYQAEALEEVLDAPHYVAAQLVRMTRQAPVETQDLTAGLPRPPCGGENAPTLRPERMEETCWRVVARCSPPPGLAPPTRRSAARCSPDSSKQASTNPAEPKNQPDWGGPTEGRPRATSAQGIPTVPTQSVDPSLGPGRFSWKEIACGGISTCPKKVAIFQARYGFRDSRVASV